MRPQPPEPPEEKRRKNSLKENIELIKGFFPYLKEHIPTLTMVLLCVLRGMRDSPAAHSA